MPDIEQTIAERSGNRTVIRLTSLIGARFVDSRGQKVGRAHDVFAVRRGPELGPLGKALQVRLILAGSGAFGDRLGYERGDVHGPWLLERFFTWLHSRKAVAVTWEDIDKIRPDVVRLTKTKDQLAVARDDLEKRDEDGMYLALGLLDRQLVDSKGRLTGNVDDLELTVPPKSDPYVSALLVGPGALAHRIGGRPGRWIESVQRRLHPAGGGPTRIPIDLVTKVESHVQLAKTREELELNRFGKWVRSTIITKIPGAG